MMKFSNVRRGRTVAVGMAAVLSMTTACVVDDEDGSLEQLEDEDASEDASEDAAENAAQDPQGPSALGTQTRPVARLPGFDLQLDVVGNDATLTWPDQGPGVVYEVFRSEFPFFAPGGTKSITLTSDVTGTSWTDVGGGNDADFFYQVRAHFPAGYFEGSTTVGKKVTPLYTGYTKIGQCLLTEVDTSAELFATVGPSAISSHMWDESIQNWAWSWNGVPGDGLVFDTGDVIVLNLDANHPPRYVDTGYVPVIEDVVMDLLPGDNLVTVLPARFGHRMASELLAAVPGATRIGLWNAATQTTAWYPDDPDFFVPSCSDVHVEVSQPTQWPPPLPECPCTASMPLWEDLIEGALQEPVDHCYDDQYVLASETFVSGADGFVAENRFEGSPWVQYKVSVGTLTASYVDAYGLDPSLVGTPSCIAYDARSGPGQVLYQLVSNDEVSACEDDLRAAVAAQPGAAVCAGGT